MNSHDLTRDQVITQLITEIMRRDPSTEDVRAALDRLNRRLGSRSTVVPPQPRPSIRNGCLAESARWRRHVLRLGIAVAVIGSVALWQSKLGSQVSAGVVFGQVLDVVRQSNSMTYTVVEHPIEGDGESIRFQVLGSRWLHIASPSKGVRIIDLKGAKMLQFDHPQFPGKQATLTTFIGQAAQALQGAAGPLAELDALLPGDGEPLGSKMVDGQAVTGFRIRRATLVGGRGDHSVWDIWADAQTAQVVGVDIHHELGEGGGRVTLIDFSFDIEFGDSLFNLQPPPGYTIVYETVEEIDPVDK